MEERKMHIVLFHNVDECLLTHYDLVTPRAFVNICSGNGLLPDGTKPCGIYLGTIPPEMFITPIINLTFKIKHLKSQLNLLGTKQLM